MRPGLLVRNGVVGSSLPLILTRGLSFGSAPTPPPPIPPSPGITPPAASSTVRIPSARQQVVTTDAATGQDVFTRPWYLYLDKLGTVATKDASSSVPDDVLAGLSYYTDIASIRAQLDARKDDDTPAQLVSLLGRIAALEEQVALLRGYINSIQVQGPFSI